MFRGLGERLGANRTVLALSLARLGDAVGNSILYVVIPLYVAVLPAPYLPFAESTRAGILIAAYGFASALVQPFVGALSDRLRRRKPLIELGLLVAGVSTLGFVPANELWQLLGLRALQGAGVALAVPPSLALITSATARQTRGGSLGIYTTLRIVGFAIGPLLGGYLLTRTGFNSTFYAGAAAILLAVGLVYIWVPEIRPPPAEDHEAIFDRELLTPAILALAFATFAMTAAFAMVVALEAQFNARLRESALGFAIGFSALMVTRLILQVPVGRLSDRYGRKPFVIIGMIVLAPATALLGYVTTALQFTGLRVLQGIGSAGVAAPAFALAGDLSRVSGRGRQLSIVTMGFALGTAVGPLFAGIVAPFSFALPFVVVAIVTLIGAAGVWRYVPETVQRE